MGNYFENLPNSRKKRASSFHDQVLIKESMEAIHNNFATVFAETGALGFVVYVLILFSFVKRDVLLFLRENNHDQKLLAISFWTLFIYGLFNPSISIGYQVVFWATRGLLIM